MKNKNINRGGSKKHPLYVMFLGMLARCYNPKHKNYDRYGGRGIKVCDRWVGENGFRYFIEDMGVRPYKYELDRIDNEKGYCPDNCKWSNRYEQTSNTSKSYKNVGVLWNVKMQKWLARIQIKYKTVYLGSFMTLQEAKNARQKAYEMVVNNA